MNRNEIINNIIMALCELGIGILLLVDPVGFAVWIFILLGIVLLIMGCMEAVAYFCSEPMIVLKRHNLAVGLVEISAGLFCIFQYNWFIATFPLLTILYGIMILFTGFVKIQWTVDMIRLNEKKWYFVAVSAVLSLVFAWVILANPFTSTAVLWTFVAVSLIVEAVADVVGLIFRKRYTGCDENHL